MAGAFEQVPAVFYLSGERFFCYNTGILLGGGNFMRNGFTLIELLVVVLIIMNLLKELLDNLI